MLECRRFKTEKRRFVFFTMIELLVVVSIIVIWSGMLQSSSGDGLISTMVGGASTAAVWL